MQDVADETVDGELVEYGTASHSALMDMERAQIDAAVSTAKKYPRSIKEFKRKAMEMACLDEETAGSMFYAIPRGGKNIEGPSVRLAEVVGASYTNLRYGARIVGTDDKFVTAQGMCFDVENNTSVSVEVKRRITDKKGRRFNDDMIQVTSNAACSIALRQAMFKVVPFAFVKPIFQEAKLCSIGKAKSTKERRNSMLDWFKKTGATEAQVLLVVGKKGVDDLTTDDLILLRGLATAIKDGETTIEEALTPPDGTAGAKAQQSPLTQTLAKGELPSSVQVLLDLDAHLAEAKNIAYINAKEGLYTPEEFDNELLNEVAKRCQAARERIQGGRGERTNQKELPT